MVSGSLLIFLVALDLGTRGWELLPVSGQLHMGSSTVQGHKGVSGQAGEVVPGLLLLLSKLPGHEPVLAQR